MRMLNAINDNPRDRPRETRQRRRLNYGTIGDLLFYGGLGTATYLGVTEWVRGEAVNALKWFYPLPISGIGLAVKLFAPRRDEARTEAATAQQTRGPAESGDAQRLRNQYEDELREKDSEIETLRRNIDALQQERGDYRNSESHLRGQMEEYEHEISRLREELENVGQRSRSEQNTYTTERFRWKKENSDLTEKYNKLTETVRNLERERDSLRAENLRYNSEIQQLRTREAIASTEIKRLRAAAERKQLPESTGQADYKNSGTDKETEED